MLPLYQSGLHASGCDLFKQFLKQSGLLEASMAILGEGRVVRNLLIKSQASEPMIMTPEEAFTVMENLPEPERTLTMLAASTSLRITCGIRWRRSSSFEGCAERLTGGIN